ncbi:hypothetical protein E2C01_089253 [Portunus trituberculatus]|uniref:Uncharacterized protein n=1 Tax=Portunus trituberculatus TaxID=210409 RepID=A0A5B7J8A7_PORTR|nr:hypothetical protein [Portunus trituberculatus]
MYTGSLRFYTLFYLYSIASFAFAPPFIASHQLLHLRPYHSSPNQKVRAAQSVLERHLRLIFMHQYT